MAIIKLGNLYSNIEDAHKRSIIAIDKELATNTPGYQFSPLYKKGHWDGKTRFLKRKGNEFPTGLLSIVVKVLTEMGEEVETVDNREQPISYTLPKEIVLKHSSLGSITLRDYQYNAVKSGLESTRGVINIATNGGKTEIACGIIQSILPNLKKGQRIIFFTHSKEIFMQSRKRIEERLGIKVGLVGSGVWDEQPVTVVMIPTIQKYLTKPKELPKAKKLKDLQEKSSNLQRLLRLKETERLGLKEQYTKEYERIKKESIQYEIEQWTKINDNVEKTKKFLDSCVAFLADEVHHASSDTWYKVFMSLENAYYRFGLTGTVDESNELNLKRLLGCTGKIITRVSNEYLIEEGYSAKPTIYMLPVPEKPFALPYMEARRKGIIESTVRNRVFTNKVIERAKIGKQCLIIVNETEHGDIVHSMLKNQGLSVKFSHGDRSDKFRDEVLGELKRGDLDVLIATTILDEGVDISGINCIFLMAGGKSMRQLLQRIGRGLRKKEDGSGLEVYDSLDYHNEYLVDHTMERYTTYKNEGFDIIKL